jgi:hypothetical protein
LEMGKEPSFYHIDYFEVHYISQHNSSAQPSPKQLHQMGCIFIVLSSVKASVLNARSAVASDTLSEDNK